MIDVIHPRARTDYVGYSHSFDAYFEQGGQRYDRRQLIQEHGILSPAEALRRGVPYKKNLNITFEGVPDYDEYIFVFPIFALGRVPVPFGNAVILDKNLPVYTPEDMDLMYDHKWVVFSRIYGGELYVPKRIGQEMFKGII